MNQDAQVKHDRGGGIDQIDRNLGKAELWAPLPSDAQAHDVYIGCHGDLNGYGGAMIAGRGLAATCEQAGLRVLLLGIGDRQPSARTTPADRAQRNISVRPSKLLWRVHNWRIPKRLEKELARLPRPRLGLVSFSAFWTVAAKRAWPDLAGNRALLRLAD